MANHSEKGAAAKNAKIAETKETRLRINVKVSENEREHERGST